MMNYPFSPEMMKYFNPQTRGQIYQAWTGNIPSQNNINNYSLLSAYARNLVRNNNPEGYLYLQNYLKQLGY